MCVCVSWYVALSHSHTHTHTHLPIVSSSARLHLLHRGIALVFAAQSMVRGCGISTSPHSPHTIFRSLVSSWSSSSMSEPKRLHVSGSLSDSAWW